MKEARLKKIGDVIKRAHGLPFFGILAIALIIITVLLIKIAIGKPGYQQKPLAQQVVETCSSNHTVECYISVFGTVSQKNNMATTVKALKDAQKIDPLLESCHLIAHKIANTEVQKDPSNWEAVLHTIDLTVCEYGFIHGVIEAHMLSDPNFRIDSQAFPAVCSYFNNNPVARSSCAHGLGHLLLVEDLMDLNKSVTTCQSLAPTTDESNCLDGVFMEYMTRANVINHGLANLLPWTEENSHLFEKVCASYSGTAGLSCWRLISLVYAKVANYEPEQLSQLCQTAPDKSQRDECYIVGLANMASMPQFTPQALETVCQTYNNQEKLYDRCTHLVVDSLIANSLSAANRPIHVCDTAKESFKATCFVYIGQALTRFNVSDNQKEQWCSPIAPTYRQLCLHAW